MLTMLLQTTLAPVSIEQSVVNWAKGLLFMDPEFLNVGERLDVLLAPFQFFWPFMWENHIKQNILFQNMAKDEL